MSDKIIEDNKELIRIIGNLLYPAKIQYEFLQKAKEEIKTMDRGRKSYALKVQEEALKWEEENKDKYTTAHLL